MAQWRTPVGQMPFQEAHDAPCPADDVEVDRESDDEEQEQVAQWLEVPPPADDLDPADVPKEHRQLFLDAAKAMILSDGSVEDVQAENLIILDQLLR